MEISVLGPLEVRGASGVIEIRGGKERLLLARLVASAGRTVGVAELIDGLWGDAPPRTAAKSLQTYVLRLRNALEPGRDGAPGLLVTDAEGYRLAVDPRQVDAQRFTRLVAAAEQARAQDRLALLREGLDLWRGPAYAGLAGSQALALEATRLEQLRLGALESRFAVETELGRHRAVVPELERMVAEHPLRERPWALLMTALYLDGRQADALAAYDRARSVLAEQLGIDPGRELRELHARVLGQDPGLGTVVRGRPVPARLVPPSTPMRGRDRELAELRHEWQAVQSGGCRTVLVRGPLGSGGRRLASALAEHVAAAGGQVVHVGTDAVDPADPDPVAPCLVVVDRGARAARLPGSAVLELRLVGPDAATDGADAVVDLAPLPPHEMQALVADRVPATEVVDATAQVGEHSHGWPGRAHAASVAWLRETASATVRAAVVEADRSRASLHDARRRLASGLLDLPQEDPRSEVRDRCPWPGLEPYDVEDGDWYAGRERLVAELVARTSGAAFLAVVGASGSGKSSAVRAGLLAALADGQLPGSAAWSHLLMRPGVHPMRELAHRVLGAHRPDAGAILERLVRADGEAGDRTVLVVDQFEEVWTACADEGERLAFLDTLADLVADEATRVTVVVALRADYLDRLADHPQLAALVGDNTVLVGAPTPDDVRRAVARPARRAGLQLDDGLVDAIVEDAGHEPGLLPLLSTSLAQLWEARDGQRLTFGGYVTVGGLRGAIGHLAEACYSALEPSAREVARTLLLRLTGPGEGNAVVRRRVALAELAGLPRHDTRAVVERLADARLLTLSEDHVEVAHEALFREWPRLRGWLSEDAAGRAVQRRLAIAAAEWEAEGREPHLLWRGSRLDSGLEVAELRPEEITAVESDFLAAGRASADAERVAAERRAEEKARQNRRLRGLLAGTAVLLVVALVAGLLALVARGRAAASAEAAEQAAVAADAKRLAASALSIEYPDLALLAAVEATRLEQSPETYGALLTLLSRQPDVVTRFRTPHRFLRNAASPDGRTVYVSENEAVLRALDAETGEQLWVRDDLAGQVGMIAPSPDGRTVAVTVLGDLQDASVTFLDPADGRELRRIPMSEAHTRSGRRSSPWIWYRLGWTADERLVFASYSHVFVADAAGRLRKAIPWPRPVVDVQALEVWPDGHVSTGLEDGEGSLVLDLDRPRAPVRATAGRLIAVSPDGTRVAEYAENETGGSIRLLDADTLEPRSRTWPVEGFAVDAAFSPDGHRLAIGVDEQVLVRDGRTAAPVQTLLGHSGTVMSVTYAGPEHDLIWTAGRDGSAVAFDVTGARGLFRTVPTRDAPHSGTAAPSGAALWTDYDEVAVNRAFLRRPDADRGRPLPLTGLGACLCQAASTELTADGRLALAGMQIFGPEGPVEDRGHLAVWDVATGQLRDRIATPWPVYGVSTTPDGERAVLNGTGGWGVLDLETMTLELGDTEPMDIPGTDGTATAEVAPDGRRAVLLREGRVLLVDLGTRELLHEAELHENPDHVLMSAAWAADGTEVAVGSSQGWFYVLDAETLAPTVPRRLITGGFVTDVEVAPDGRTAATIGSDGDVTLWDVASWRPYGQPILDDQGWGFLSFAADSAVLRVEYELGSRVEVGTRPDGWVAAACAAAHRDLTVDENAIVRPGLPMRPTCA